MLCSVRPMCTAVMGPIVNVPSLHLTSLADTGSNELISSICRWLRAHICIHVCVSVFERLTLYKCVGRLREWVKEEVWRVGRWMCGCVMALNRSTEMRANTHCSMTHYTQPCRKSLAKIYSNLRLRMWQKETRITVIEDITWSKVSICQTYHLILVFRQRKVGAFMNEFFIHIVWVWCSLVPLMKKRMDMPDLHLKDKWLTGRKKNNNNIRTKITLIH